MGKGWYYCTNLCSHKGTHAQHRDTRSTQPSYGLYCSQLHAAFFVREGFQKKIGKPFPCSCISVQRRGVQKEKRGMNDLHICRYGNYHYT